MERATIRLSYTAHNLRHFAVAQFYLQHGPTTTISPVRPTTELEVMQGQKFDALGKYMGMTNDIGKQLAAIIDVFTITANSASTAAPLVLHCHHSPDVPPGNDIQNPPGAH